MTKYTLTGGVFGAALVALSISAHGASLNANATVELVSLTTTGTSTFEFTGGFFFAGAIVNDVSNFVDSEFSAGISPVSANATANAGGTQTANAQAGFPVASAEALAIATGDALGVTLSEMNFELNGTGEVTLIFESTLAIDVTDTAGIEFAEAAVTVTDAFGAFEQAYASADGALGDTAFQDVSTLTLTYFVDGTTTGFLSLETAVLADTGVAAIPLPAAGWLLTGGLFSLLGLRRRRA